MTTSRRAIGAKIASVARRAGIDILRYFVIPN
jgi:hypothetical protein